MYIYFYIHVCILSLYIYMYMYSHLYTIFIYIHIYVYICFIRIHIYNVYVYIYTHVHIYIYIYLFTYVYTCICICLYSCMCKYINIYAHIFMCTLTSRQLPTAGNDLSHGHRCARAMELWSRLTMHLQNDSSIKDAQNWEDPWEKWILKSQLPLLFYIHSHS